MAGLLYIIKIGGNVVDDEHKLDAFIRSIAALRENKIIVHGGGKLATQLAEQLNLPQQMIDGRRITDTNTLKIVTMVYAGYINKNIVAQLQANGCNALGLTGADGNAILAHKRNHPTIDYGWAGDIDKINAAWISHLLAERITPVMAPITHNGYGQLLNTNADTVASEMAVAMSAHHSVHLVFGFEKPGVLLDAADESTVIPALDAVLYKKLKSEKKIFAGMIPKLDNAFASLTRGVKKVIIGPADNLDVLLEGKAGTAIVP